MEVMGGLVCVIYATSPLLEAHDLLEGYAALQQETWRNFVRSVGPDGEDAGCFYFGWTRSFRDRKPLDSDKTLDYALPAERVCDINTEPDWTRAESLYALRRAS
jgi:CMP-N-acetylneuraminic acid synthetase